MRKAPETYHCCYQACKRNGSSSICWRVIWTNLKFDYHKIPKYRGFIFLLSYHFVQIFDFCPTFVKQGDYKYANKCINIHIKPQVYDCFQTDQRLCFSFFLYFQQMCSLLLQLLSVLIFLGHL